MARVVTLTRAQFNNEQYGGMTRDTYDFLNNQFQQNINNGMFQGNHQMVEKIQNDIEKYAFTSVQLAEMSLEGSRNLLQDGIYTMNTSRDFATASNLSQQYLAANPTVVSEVKMGRIAGWTDTLPEDYYENCFYDDRYKEVMDGQALTVEEDGVEEDIFKVYFMDEISETPLKFNEKVIMRENWKRLDSILLGNHDEDVKDPTDIYGGYL